MNEFQHSFDSYVNENDIDEANRVLMQELGSILLSDRSDFVALLVESGVKASVDISDANLINLFIENIQSNKELMVGTALLINHHNKTMGFDGDNEINDQSVKDSYSVMYSYFDDVYDVDDEGNSEFVGALIKGASSLMNKNGNGGGGGDAQNTLAKGGVGIANKLLENRRRSKHGAIDELYKQREAKRQMVKAVMEQRQKEQQVKAEQLKAKQKNTKIGLIIGGSVFGLVVIGGLFYALKK